MILHISIRDVVERCIGTESQLAIFKANNPYHGNYRFNVLFADTVQTQHDIKNNRDFICLFNPSDSLEELEQSLKQYLGA